MAVGGGAGGLGRDVAATLGLECVVPPDAEVISSIGDALSLVRAERERTVADPTAADVDALDRRGRAGGRRGRGRAGVARGAGRVRRRPQGAARGRDRVDRARGRRGCPAGSPPRRDRSPTRAAEHGCDAPAASGSSGSRRGEDRVVVLDRFGDVVVDT